MDAPKKEISKIIESIVLQDDFRGMTALSPHMKKNYIDSSSNLLLKTQGEIMIITGFYIIDAKASETDGPPGAVAMSNALKTLGFSTSLVTDKNSYEIVKAISDETEVIEFPITDHRESAEFAKNLLSERNVGALISIERAGLVGDGTYRNWKGVDISPYNAKRLYLDLIVITSYYSKDIYKQIKKMHFKCKVLNIFPDIKIIN